jgi:hypothetical protein
MYRMLEEPAALLGPPEIERDPEKRIEVVCSEIFQQAVNRATVKAYYGRCIERELAIIDRNYRKAKNLAEKLTPEKKAEKMQLLRESYDRSMMEISEAGGRDSDFAKYL